MTSTNTRAALTSPFTMSGHPQGHYDDGYGHQQHGNDVYYQDDQQGYHDQYDYNHHDQQGHPQGGEGYYDES